MSAPEYYEATFKWPHPEANAVVVTGEFDTWTGSHHLARTASGFEGSVQVPWGRKIAYKYIVDGRWTTTDDQPTELDSLGNLNNVYNVPARPATPKVVPPPAPEPVSESAPALNPVTSMNGILSSAKNAAVAMVEAIAPGTTETPQPTPAVTSDPIQDPITEATTQVKEVAIEPAAEVLKHPAETIQSQVEETVVPVAEPEPALAKKVVPTPKKEVDAEAILPVVVEEIKTAPIVPIPILPLAAAADVAATDGKVEKPLETNVVEGSTASEVKVEPVTVSETADAPNGTVVQPSTHTPAVNGAESIPPIVHASDAPTTNGAAAADVPSRTANGNGTHEKPAEVPLPLPTPSEVPLPSTPAANGTHAETPASSPPSSPRKEKRHFPTFGRHHKQASSSSVASSGVASSGTPDEHGVLQSPSRKGTQKKKRTSSVFGKIKDFFGDDHHKKEKKATA